MEEIKPAVSAESAPATEVKEVVNTPESTTEQAQTTEQVKETATPPQGEASYEAVDETGVPYKNRTFEWKRKYEDTIDKLPSLIDEAVKNSVQQYSQPPQKEHTIAELEQFAMDNPENRPWVEEQKALLIRKQTIGDFEQKMKVEESRKQGEALRQQSFNYVAQNCPDIFVKNAQGQVLGLAQTEVAREFDALMKEPEIVNNPRGMFVAAQMAYGNFYRKQQGMNQLKEQKLQAEVKHLQKGTLVEGGTKTNVQAVPAHKIALEKAKQTGNLKDVAAALKAISEARKASKE